MNTTATPTATEFTGRTIHAGAIPELTKRFERMAKKADTWNIPRPTLHVSDPYAKHLRSDVTGEIIATIRVADIAVIMPATVIVDGWTVVASIDIVDGVNIVHLIGDELDEIPTWMTEVTGSRCDHCNTNRARKSLVAIQNVDDPDTMKVIGRSCTRDYMGVDLKAFLNWHRAGFEMLSDWDDFDDVDTFASRGIGQLYPLDIVVGLAAAAIARDGYIPAQAMESTKWDVMGSIRHGVADITIADEHADTATAALNWVRTLTGANDFEQNLLAIRANDFIDARQLGLACYIPEGYQRHLDQVEAERAKAEARANNIGHWGTMGERAELTAKVTHVNTSYSQWGDSYWVKAVTPEGHRIEWKSSRMEPYVGDVLTGRATVDAHTEWENPTTKEIQLTTKVTRWAATTAEEAA